MKFLVTDLSSDGRYDMIERIKSYRGGLYLLNFLFRLITNTLGYSPEVSFNFCLSLEM